MSGSEFNQLAESYEDRFNFGGSSSSFVPPIQLGTPGSPAMDGMWMLNDQLAPDYLGIYASGTFVYGGMGGSLDLNIGYMRGQGTKFHVDAKGGIGHDIGLS